MSKNGVYLSIESFPFLFWSVIPALSWLGNNQIDSLAPTLLSECFLVPKEFLGVRIACDTVGMLCKRCLPKAIALASLGLVEFGLSVVLV